MPDGVVGVTSRLRRDAASLVANVLPTKSARPLCIVTTGRAGSSLLVTLLDAHPKMRCHGEIFEHWHDFPYLLIRGRLRGAKLRGLDAYGFKINTNNLGPAWSRDGSRRARVLRPFAFIERLHRDGTVFVHVRRRNVYRQTISSMRNAAHERMYDGLRPSDRGPLEIDPVQLLANMYRMDTQDARIAEVVGPLGAIDVWYEDDLEDAAKHQAVADRIFTALGLTPHPVATTKRKLASRDLRDDVANLDEVERAVRATRFARFLDGA